MFVIIAGVRQDLLLHEAAIKNDINATMKLIHMNADLNSKSHVKSMFPWKFALHFLCLDAKSTNSLGHNP